MVLALIQCGRGLYKCVSGKWRWLGTILKPGSHLGFLFFVTTKTQLVHPISLRRCRLLSKRWKNLTSERKDPPNVGVSFGKYIFLSDSIFLTFNFDYGDYKIFNCNDIPKSWELLITTLYKLERWWDQDQNHIFKNPWHVSTVNF